MSSRFDVTAIALLAVLLLSGAVGTPGASASETEAESPRPMTAVDLIGLPSLGSPRLSPDGARAVFTLSEADWKENKRVGHLWLSDIEGGEARQLTFGDSGESSPRWALPSKELAPFPPNAASRPTSRRSTRSRS